MFTEGQGSEVIYGVADYWVSRATWKSADQQYHLLGKKHYHKDTSSYTKFIWPDMVITLKQNKRHLVVGKLSVYREIKLGSQTTISQFTFFYCYVALFLK